MADAERRCAVQTSIKLQSEQVFPVSYEFPLNLSFIFPAGEGEWNLITPADYNVLSEVREIISPVSRAAFQKTTLFPSPFPPSHPVEPPYAGDLLFNYQTRGKQVQYLHETCRPAD